MPPKLFGDSAKYCKVIMWHNSIFYKNLMVKKINEIRNYKKKQKNKKIKGKQACAHGPLRLQKGPNPSPSNPLPPAHRRPWMAVLAAMPAPWPRAGDPTAPWEDKASPCASSTEP